MSRLERARGAVTLYTRRGCGLCEEAAALLASLAPRHGLALRTVDVDGDPRLAEEYGDWVPVALGPDGRELFRLQADAAGLDGLLAEAARKERVQ